MSAYKVPRFIEFRDVLLAMARSVRPVESGTLPGIDSGGVAFSQAGQGIRTLDFNLGKGAVVSHDDENAVDSWRCDDTKGGDS